MSITIGEVSIFAGSETSLSCIRVSVGTVTWFCGPAFDIDGIAYAHWLLYMKSCYTKLATTVWTTARAGTRGNYDSVENIDPFRHGNAMDF
jgi:hypothetical protein